MNTARYSSGSANQGTQTAALVFGGTPMTTATESYNGTSWTTVNSLNTTRTQLTGGGIQTLAFAAGGNTPPANTKTGSTELWDGTSWTSSPPLTTARAVLGGAGSLSSGIVFGGYTTTSVANTEKWSGPQTTITASTLTTS